MIKNTNQTQTLILTVVVLAFVGALAGYNVFQNQQKKEALSKLRNEANTFLNEIEALFTDEKTCTLNLKGHKRNDFLEKLYSTDPQNPLYELNKPQGQFKIDKITTKLDFENQFDSTVKVIFEISNAHDANSKEQLGIHTFKKEVIVKVDDCALEYVKANDKNLATKNCEELPPDGLRGKSVELIETMVDSMPYYVLSCKICRDRNRETIANCL